MFKSGDKSYPVGSSTTYPLSDHVQCRNPGTILGTEPPEPDCWKNLFQRHRRSWWAQTFRQYNAAKWSTEKYFQRSSLSVSHCAEMQLPGTWLWRYLLKKLYARKSRIWKTFSKWTSVFEGQTCNHTYWSLKLIAFQTFSHGKNQLKFKKPTCYCRETCLCMALNTPPPTLLLSSLVRLFCEQWNLWNMISTQLCALWLNFLWFYVMNVYESFLRGWCTHTILFLYRFPGI